MIGWLITVAILILFAFILFSKVRFYAEAEKGDVFKLICKFWFFKVFELPSEDVTDNEQTKVSTKQKTDSRSLKTLNIKIKTYDDVIQLLHSVKSILSNFKTLIKRVVITNTEFKLVVVGNDAADTALKYGAVCSAAYPVITLMSECFTFKPDKIDISAGFDKKEIDFHFKTDFSVRIIYLVVFAVSTVKEYIKVKKGV